MRTYLDFEKKIAELESKVSELKSIGSDDQNEEESSISIDDEIHTLEEKARKALVDTYANLTPWQKCQVARHPDRPHCMAYVDAMITDFVPLSGDRYFSDDDAIVAGVGRFRGRSVVVLGHEKGHDTESRIKHNFGMARPEGYRKAVRLMDMADKFGMPIITFVDTAGAFPGIGAEERGQAEAIARSTDRCLALNVPMITLVIGEGGSGGALAIATANQVLMLEHSIYTVASPEAAASILWHDSTRAKDAATNMRITAQDLDELGIIDGIITEPIGGAHRNPEKTIESASNMIDKRLQSFETMTGDEIRQQRQQKFLDIGKSLH
ncbi:MAG: acetyl-coenzyme A carboxylase carboxyl transferase subunit alpha [Rhodomicrobium sp.]|nr:MAG: acetyl-coenzyme A carboxylase carboxyl transferase subunit alpha [Rhodomicrobium sp.]